MVERINDITFRPLFDNYMPFLSRLKEFKTIGIVFICIFFGMLIFTNANLFLHALGVTSDTVSGNSLFLTEEITITDSITNTQERGKWIDTLLQKYQNSDTVQSPIAHDIQTIEQNKLSYYGFDFNTLPPVDRLVIPSISLDVPVISSTNITVDDFQKGNFATALTEGVVKYPTTPAPGESGNTLIFGHTSQEFRQKNPYGTVFSNISQLHPGDEIKVVRGGELYTYKVVETVIRIPKDVDHEFQKRENKDKEYITLLGCYPLGTTNKRMMVMAERTN